MEYELEQARLHANIDVATWESIPCSYIWMTEEHRYCKADYIVIYRLANQINSVSSDIQNREIDKQRRNAKHRGK